MSTVLHAVAFFNQNINILWFQVSFFVLKYKHAMEKFKKGEKQ